MGIGLGVEVKGGGWVGLRFVDERISFVLDVFDCWFGLVKLGLNWDCYADCRGGSEW